VHDETQHSTTGVPEHRDELIPHAALTPDIYDAIIIVTGSPNFNDYDLFCDRLEERLLRDDIVDLPLICFVSGKSKKGADDMIIRWCRENHFPWAEFPADWEGMGRSAGFAHNTQMARVGTHLIAFWDMESGETKHMIEEAHKYKVSVSIVMVDPDPDWQERAYRTNHGRKSQGR
jgi:hypothetical protein